MKYLLKTFKGYHEYISSIHSQVSKCGFMNRAYRGLMVLSFGDKLPSSPLRRANGPIGIGLTEGFCS